MSTPEPAYVTPRGFTGYADLTDRYGASLRVQGSSLATEPCVWIFAETGSAHLTVEQARTVRDALTNWLNEHTADRPSVTDNARAEARNSSHIGRSFHDTRLEDDCPCPKGPCGLAIHDGTDHGCDQHDLGAARTIRQMHSAADCPATGRAEPTTLMDAQDLTARITREHGKP